MNPGVAVEVCQAAGDIVPVGGRVLVEQRSNVGGSIGYLLWKLQRFMVWNFPVHIETCPIAIELFLFR